MRLWAPKGRQHTNGATTIRTKITPWQEAMLGGRGARWQGDSQVSPGRGAGGDVGEGRGAASGWERGLLRSKLRTTEHLIFTPRTGAGAASRLRAAVCLSPPKPGESPRGSYAIVGKSSNCRDNATGVTHASTESCGVRLEITHIHIYRACLRFNPFQHGAESHRPLPMSPHPTSKSSSPLPAERTHQAPFTEITCSLLKAALGVNAK